MKVLQNFQHLDSQNLGERRELHPRSQEEDPEQALEPLLIHHFSGTWHLGNPWHLAVAREKRFFFFFFFFFFRFWDLLLVFVSGSFKNMFMFWEVLLRKSKPFWDRQLPVGISWLIFWKGFKPPSSVVSSTLCFLPFCLLYSLVLAHL